MNLFKKVRIFRVSAETPEEDAIEAAAELLRNGGLVVFPTETVYGLGANLLNEKAVSRVYKIKRRPKDKPLTIHIADLKILNEMVSDIPRIARVFIKKFWPGPLTIVFDSRDKRKLGFRMPSNTVARALIERSGVPVVAPSANLSGEKAPRDVSEVLKSLDNRMDMILDAGPAKVGIESTVIDVTEFPYRILREGAIPKSSLKDAWQHEE